MHKEQINLYGGYNFINAISNLFTFITLFILGGLIYYVYKIKQTTDNLITTNNLSVKDKICINNTCLNELDIKRNLSIMPSGYINVVNKRPLLGVGITVYKVVTGSVPSLLVSGIVYNPFDYNVPPPALGTTRQYRLYCVYSDNITGGDGPIVRLSVLRNTTNWPEDNNYVDFKLPLTWGGISGETRDAFSQLVSTPQNPMHCKLYSFIPSTAQGTAPISVLWNYIELQALDVYP